MESFIPYGKQWISDDDIKEVERVLRSDFLTQGPEVKIFEDKLCTLTGAKYCVAVANGTAALHIAVAALKIDMGSEGITSPNTFAASANCMLYNGLIPRFADINPQTHNIDPEQITSIVNEKTKLIIPVHFAGLPAEMGKISKIAKQHDLYVIEDAAHAIGSQYADRTYVGNCIYSDMTIFSFHPVKTITTGEGGAITTNSEVLYERLLMLRSHGITKDTDKLSINPGPWYYEMQELGYNYRLTDMQAALGSSQLTRLHDFKHRRREIIKRYSKAFREVPWLTIPMEPEDVSSCFHLYVLRFNFLTLGKTRSEIMNHLFDHNVGTQVHYIPVNQLPYFSKRNKDKTPNSDSYYEQCLSIPLYPRMSDSDVDHVIESILKLPL
ncbi:MAG: UDP-4-amino-4,6-dideoxy-N-acetyl-beta-L-altrosamine transaminase [Candidatus Marinimicrobia bacterium]|nr:UDP-4-amino-4,6-dideoxy-N-acetyl-beta-L-altrosamine transaminase [Candidatus Neomarinimicrobiota bacterium]